MVGEKMKNRYKKTAWERKRAWILSKYNYVCQEGKRYNSGEEAVMVHHIYPIEKYPELMYVDWNLLPLSNKNHNRMHIRNSHELTALGKLWQRKKKRLFDRWLEEKESNKNG